jgi:hypothetical protein
MPSGQNNRHWQLFWLKRKLLQMPSGKKEGIANAFN